MSFLLFKKEGKKKNNRCVGKYFSSFPYKFQINRGIALLLFRLRNRIRKEQRISYCKFAFKTYFAILFNCFEKFNY